MSQATAILRRPSSTQPPAAALAFAMTGCGPPPEQNPEQPGAVVIRTSAITANADHSAVLVAHQSPPRRKDPLLPQSQRDQRRTQSIAEFPGFLPGAPSRALHVWRQHRGERQPRTGFAVAAQRRRQQQMQGRVLGHRLSGTLDENVGCYAPSGDRKMRCSPRPPAAERSRHRAVRRRLPVERQRQLVGQQASNGPGSRAGIATGDPPRHRRLRRHLPGLAVTSTTPTGARVAHGDPIRLLGDGLLQDQLLEELRADRRIRVHRYNASGSARN